MTDHLTGGRNAVTGCSCDWCEAFRANRRRKDKLLRLGRGTLLGAAHAEAAGRRVEQLRSRGMSLPMISAASGLGTATLSRYLNRQRSQIRRDCWERLQAVTPPEGPSRTPRRAGTYVDATGTARRLQALHARGWSFVWMAKELGAARTGTWPIAAGRIKHVSWQMQVDVRTLYDKYQHVDPLDVGERLQVVNRIKAAATRLGYAPPACWDDDLIDDPTVVAQWTGECGTRRGYDLHRYRGLVPACRPCRDAANKSELARRKREG